MQKRKLGNTELYLSEIGYGCGPLAGFFGDAEQKEINAAVHRAIDLGINFFDTAPLYSSEKQQSEVVLGIALSTIPREKYYISTKCGRLGVDTFKYDAPSIVKTVNESIKKLQVTYLDCITVHDIEFSDDLDQIVNETVPALRQLQKEGKVKYVGISGYPLNVLLHVVKRVKLDFVLTYCHYNLQNTLLEQYVPEFQKYGVGIINASPLSMGLLTMPGPPPFHPANKELRETGKNASKLCEENGVDIANLALKWALSSPLVTSGAVATTLLGMKSIKEVEANVNTLKSELNKEVLSKVLEIYKPWHNYSWDNSKWKHL